MRTNWMIDVLTDLKAFAEHNGLDATAAALDDAALVAMAETFSQEKRGKQGRAPEQMDLSHLGENITDLGSYRTGV